MNKTLKLALVAVTVLFTVPSYGMFGSKIKHAFKAGKVAAKSSCFSSSKTTLKNSTPNKIILEIKILEQGNDIKPKETTKTNIAGEGYNPFFDANTKDSCGYLIGKKTIQTTLEKQLLFRNFLNYNKNDFILDEVNATYSTDTRKTIETRRTEIVIETKNPKDLLNLLKTLDLICDTDKRDSFYNNTKKYPPRNN